jgi:1-acyl-sn-glycerol-3-phosphate acyltransferase
MTLLRVTVRAFAFCAVTGALYALLLCGLPFVAASEMATARWQHFVFRRWARALSAILHLQTEVCGTPPEPPFFLVSNHLSYLDIIVFAAQLDCVFIAKKEIEGWPVFGRICRSVGTIFVDRAERRDVTRVNELIERALGRRQGVILFPEGTSTKGELVLPFKSSLLEPAARAVRPVSYATLSYRAPADQTPAHLSVCWWGEMGFLSHLLGLLRLREVHATIVFGPETIQEENRKLLANKLWLAAKEQFIPTVSPEAVVNPEEECSATR